MILAAGQGTRLRPLTNHKPKCLVPLLDKPLLAHQYQVLQQCGIQDIQVVCGFCAEQIRELGYACIENPHYANTNMVSSLFCARAVLRKAAARQQDVIIAYGDIVYQADNLRAVLDSRAEIAVMTDRKWRDLWHLRMQDPLMDAETLKTDTRNHIIELGKKPKGYDDIQGQYTGLFKFRADKILDIIRFYEHLDQNLSYDGKDFNNMYMTTFLQLLIDNNFQTKAVWVDNGWLEIDSVADLEVYESLAKQGRLDNFYHREA